MFAQIPGNSLSEVGQTLCGLSGVLMSILLSLHCFCQEYWSCTVYMRFNFGQFGLYDDDLIA